MILLLEDAEKYESSVESYYRLKQMFPRGLKGLQRMWICTWMRFNLTLNDIETVTECKNCDFVGFPCANCATYIFKCPHLGCS